MDVFIFESTSKKITLVIQMIISYFDFFLL